MNREQGPAGEGVGRVRAVCGRLSASGPLPAPLAESTYDVMFVRWVLFCVPGAADAVGVLASRLRPGGALVCAEFSAPFVSRPHTRLLDEAYVHMRALLQPGDIDIGRRLRAIATRAGLAVEGEHTQRLAGGRGSAVYDWVNQFLQLHVLPHGAVTPAAHAEWLAFLRDPSGVLLSPQVTQLVARAHSS